MIPKVWRFPACASLTVPSRSKDIPTMRAEFIDPSLPHAPFEVKGLPYRARRTVGDRLLEALMALAEPQASLLSHNQKP